MRKLLAGILTALGILASLPSFALVSEFQSERGLNLPLKEERALVAAECAIWQYEGTREQNERLAACYNNTDETVGYSVVSRYRTTLQSSMSSSQTTIPVSSIVTFDGTTLSMGLLGPRVFLTVEPGTAREEIVMCTAITNSQFSTCTRGLAFSGTSTTAVANNQKAHNAGSIVVMSNVHYVYEQFLDLDSTETVTGDKTFSGTIGFTNLPTTTTSTPTLPGQLVTLNYLTSVTSTGCSDASTSIRGCVEEATDAELQAGTATGTTGARLFANGASFTSTSAANKVPVADNLGKLSVNWITTNTAGGIPSLDANLLVQQNPASATTTPGASKIVISDASSTVNSWVTYTYGIFGDGSGGDVTLSGTTTITQDMYYNNLTFNTNAVLVTNGYKVFVRGTLTGANGAKFSNNGNNASGSSAGAAISAGTTGASGAGGAGTSGGTGNTGGSVSNSLGGSGGTSGANGTCTNGGTAGVATTTTPPRSSVLLPSLIDYRSATYARFTGGAGGRGAGGAGGGGDSGGGGGGGAGVVPVFANSVVGPITLEAKGGNGGNGSGTGAGGGGGGGGSTILGYKTKSGTITHTVTGGALGTGSGCPDGVAGSNGNSYEILF